jgi:hypothetical protein
MSFPNVIYGRYGDEKVTAASAIGGLPLGQKMILPDGREFALCKEGGTAGIAGNIYIQEAAVADHGNVAGSALQVAVSADVGATTVVVTAGGTTVIGADEYASGYLNITAGSTSAAVGHLYRIKSNNAATKSVTCTITLEPFDGIASALVASSTLVSLRVSPFKNLILKAAASTFVGAVAGVLPVAIPANYYGWVQRAGVATVLQAATATSIGNYVCCSSTDAGAVSTLLAAATTLYDHIVVGQTIAASDASKYAVTMLKLN